MKFAIPEPPAGHVRRASLVRRLDSLLEWRLTVLRAPAGFGKTTLLADVCRRKQKEVVVGWLALDAHDTPSELASLVASAFDRAGMDLALLREFDGWSSLQAAQQMGLLARAVELHAAPCLLVLDNADRLRPRSADWLDRLVKRGPGNLHVAIACRSNPTINLTGHELDGSVRIVGTEQLRFSAAEVGRYYRGELSGRELAAVCERTAGWPLAVAHCRGAPGPGNSEPDAGSIQADFVGIRLLRSLPAEIRTALLDLAVFDRIDADLVDAVLGSSADRLRVVRRPELDGFFLPADDNGAALCLHPLSRRIASSGWRWKTRPASKPCTPGSRTHWRGSSGGLSAGDYREKDNDQRADQPEELAGQLLVHGLEAPVHGLVDRAEPLVEPLLDGLEPLVARLEPPVDGLESAVNGLESAIHRLEALHDRFAQPVDPACVFCHLVLDYR